MNRDGIADLISANGGGNAVDVCLGNGDGTFADPMGVAVGQIPLQVVVTDFNGDGIPDLVTADAGGNVGAVEVALGNGDGTFRTLPQVDVGAFVDSVAVADFNGDGKPDIAVSFAGDIQPGQYSLGGVAVMLGKGDGTFQPPTTIATGTQPSGIAAVDVNGDGNLDLVAGDPDQSSFATSILLGDGHGNFTVTKLGNDFPRSGTVERLTSADLNGDSIPDLVASVEENRVIAIEGPPA